jgi:Domain of unknown function (DUF4129)
LVACWLGRKWLGRKLLRRHGRTAHGTRQRKNITIAPQIRPEARDSEFYLVEKYLLTQGAGRSEHETLTCWQQRIAPQIGAAAAVGLTEIIHLHYRCRFGREPSAAGRDALRRACTDWLAEFSRKPDQV